VSIPYGEFKRPLKRSSEPQKPGADGPFKIKFRAKDNAFLSMQEMQQGLLEAIHALREHNGLQVKWATLYLTLVDESGNEVSLNSNGEMELHPYRSAADQLGL
jgi:hypothetical protein